MNIAVKFVVALISMQSIEVHALKCYQYDEVQCVDDGSNALMGFVCAFMETANQNSTRQICTVEEPGSCMKVTTAMTISGISMHSTHAACQSGPVDDKCYSQAEMEDVFSELDMGDMPSNAEVGELDACFCTTDLCNTGSAVTASWINLVNSILLAATALCITYKA
ncbi:hypothetical protein HOLleu_40364 [Holothuria leucospilota]|uniref:Uncharacterized protein n=1 Tax=Holothuria leucospilota TaxID=206669 RepID=A0A9Q1BBM9_HOLLE|nr:hypothetical protein HOLleu_40364 [Holothuria leucospilota]